MTAVDLFSINRLARAAADMGHYNVAKLLQATHASILNRRLYGESLPKTDGDLVAALGTLQAELEAEGLDLDLARVFGEARAALATRGVVTYRDVPVLLVCRVCGEAVRGYAPEYCPGCGAGELTFQDFPIVYYLEPVAVPVILGELAETPGWLDRQLHALTPEQAARQVEGAEGAWSLADAAGHLLGANELLALRVRMFLERESPDLEAVDPRQVMQAPPADPRELTARFREARTALLAQLGGLDPLWWLHVGRHSEFGLVTLQQQVTYFARHEQWHMAQMTRMRAALG